MSHQVVEINCPGCGARVSTEQKECEWCHKPIIINVLGATETVPILKIPIIDKKSGYFDMMRGEKPWHFLIKILTKLPMLVAKSIGLMSLKTAVRENY